MFVSVFWFSVVNLMLFSSWKKVLEGEKVEVKVEKQERDEVTQLNVPE